MKTETTIKYVWLDEDEEEVSPRHLEFKTALSFISGWHARWQRLQEGTGPRNLQLSTMTKTGKPPVRLTRIVIVSQYEALDEPEQITLSAFFQAQSAAGTR